MSYFNTIKRGDYVINRRYDPKCVALNEYFKGEHKKVMRTENNDYEYAGCQFVYVVIDGKETGFYYNALIKR